MPGAPALALLALGVDRARADEQGEWEREADPDLFFVSPVDSDGHPTHVVVRVVDDQTGEGLPGATVALHSQDEYPITGLVAADRTGVSDTDGWVRIRANDLGWEPTWTLAYWLYVEAAEHAGAALPPGRGPQGFEIRLQRAHNVVVEVRDALDRPLSGAVIGVRNSRSCGHMNDQRIAVSGLDGMAVIPGLCAEGDYAVNPGWECCVVADGIELDYHNLVVPTRPSPPQILRHLPSRPIVGVNLDSTGEPLAGAHVGGGSFHRGPWALTDTEGRFRLVGTDLDSLDPTVEVVQEHDGMYADGHPPSPTFVAPPPGVRRVFRMPVPGEPPHKEAMVEVQVAARDSLSGEMIEDAPLVAWRDEDGWTARGSGEIDALPRGSFTILAGGGLSPYAPTRARIEVKDEEPAPLLLDVTRHPAVRVVLEDDPEEVETGVVSIALISAGDMREDGVAEEARAGRVSVPPDIECAFRVHFASEDHTHVEFFPIPPERGADQPPIRIHATRMAVVKARLAGPDGTVVPGWLLDRVQRHLDAWWQHWEPETPAEEEPAVSLYEEGVVELLAVPEGRTLVPKIIAAQVPTGSRGGAAVDLGTVRLEARGDRRLTILSTDGNPAETDSVRVIHDGVLRRLYPTEDDVYDPLLVPLAPGDEVIATARWSEDDVLVRTIRKTLEGPGPWTLRGDEPRTSLTVDATDENGNEILDAILVIDGRAYTETAYEDKSGKRHLVAIPGISPGPHRIAVAARNHRTRLYRIVLKAGERRTLTARLRSCPSER